MSFLVHISVSFRPGQARSLVLFILPLLSMKGLHFARPNVMPMSELNTRVRCINGSLPCSFLAYSLMSSVHVEEVADNGTTFKLVSIDTVVQQSAHQVEVNTEQQGWQSISSIYTAFDGDICETL